MTWSDFYLLCFLVGFSLSVLSFLAGAVHLPLPFKIHLPFHGAHHGGGGASYGGVGGGPRLSLFGASAAMALPGRVRGPGQLPARRPHPLPAGPCLPPPVAA